MSCLPAALRGIAVRCLPFHFVVSLKLPVLPHPFPCRCCSMTTAQLQQELSQLDSQLAAKLAAMQSVSIHPALKENYDKRVQELEAERRELQQERRELLRKLDTLQHESGGWLGGWVARVLLGGV